MLLVACRVHPLPIHVGQVSWSAAKKIVVTGTCATDRRLLIYASPSGARRRGLPLVPDPLCTKTTAARVELPDRLLRLPVVRGDPVAAGPRPLAVLQCLLVAVRVAGAGSECSIAVSYASHSLLCILSRIFTAYVHGLEVLYGSAVTLEDAEDFYAQIGAIAANSKTS